MGGSLPHCPFFYYGTVDEGIKRSIQQAAAVLRELGAREVYVFGSAARGTLRPGSDVDLAVSGLPPAVFFRAMSKAADLLDRPLDLIDLDQDVPFTQYLKEEGELLRVGQTPQADRGGTEAIESPH